MRRMGKVFFGMAVAAVVVLSFGCGTTSKTESSDIKTGDTFKGGRKKFELVDHQGATFNQPVPDWVLKVSQGQYDAAYLSKSMTGLDGKKAFVVQGRGNNLSFVKSWVNLYDIETEVGGMLERQSGKVVTQKMKGGQSESGTEISPAEVEKKLTDYRMAMQNVRIVGLEKVAEYWDYIEVTEGGKVVDSYYDYYSVWAMDKKLLSIQLNNALKNEPDGELKTAVMNAITNELTVGSNNKEVEEQADNYFLDASTSNYFIYN